MRNERCLQGGITTPPPELVLFSARVSQIRNEIRARIAGEAGLKLSSTQISIRCNADLLMRWLDFILVIYRGLLIGFIFVLGRMP